MKMSISDMFLEFLVFIVVGGMPVAVIAILQLILFRCKKRVFHFLLLILAGIYWLAIEVLLIIESSIVGKLDIFNNWLDSELVLFEFILFGMGELIAWCIYLIRKRRRSDTNGATPFC